VSKSDVIIIGGGVIGCSVAFHLVKAGLACAVLDRGELGREASWASAGILTHGNRSSFSTYGRMATESRAMYPALVTELRARTALDLDYRESGGLHVFFEEAEAAGAADYCAESRRRDIACDLLSAEELRAEEPTVAQDALCALRFPDDGSIRPQRLTRALAQAAATMGARLLPHTPVVDFVRNGDRIVGVVTRGGVIEGDQFVLTAGAWSGQLGERLGVAVAVGPSKGQIVLLEAAPSAVRHVIHAGDNYLVPRSDGMVIIGATVEDAGFDKSSTADGVQSLLDWALRVAPGLRAARFVTAWAGLRPASSEGLIIQRAAGLANVIVATGHNRNGILLAPATGVRVRELLFSTGL